MKLFLLACLFLIGGQTATGLGADQSIVARVTVYWPGETGSRASWNGGKLQNGHCAVDPEKIPYGSKVVIGNEELTAVDTGPAVIKRKAARSCGRTAAERNAPVIDRFFESRAEAKAWENSHPHFMTVRVVTAGPEVAVPRAKSRAGWGDGLLAAGNPFSFVAALLLLATS